SAETKVTAVSRRLRTAKKTQEKYAAEEAEPPGPGPTGGVRVEVVGRGRRVCSGPVDCPAASGCWFKSVFVVPLQLCTLAGTERLTRPGGLASFIRNSPRYAAPPRRATSGWRHSARMAAVRIFLKPHPETPGDLLWLLALPRERSRGDVKKAMKEGVALGHELQGATPGQAQTTSLVPRQAYRLPPPQTSEQHSYMVSVGKTKEHSKAIRDKIVEGHKAGKGCKTLSKELGLPASTVESIIRKWKAYGATANLPQPGQPFKVSSHAEARLV
ncbi:hypothetical protein P4O66_020089, partial [Electrophorus voltai]